MLETRKLNSTQFRQYPLNVNCATLLIMTHYSFTISSTFVPSPSTTNTHLCTFMLCLFACYEASLGSYKSAI